LAGLPNGRHDFTALLAGSKFFVVEETVVGFGDRVFGIIAHDEDFLVQEGIAFLAIPLEAVDLAFPPLSFRN
jgi:hypothetical protein